MSSERATRSPSHFEGAAATELRLREATRADLDSTRELTARLFLAYGSYDDYVGDWFVDAAVRTFVAEVRERFIGFAMLAVYPDAPIPKGAGPLVAELLAIGVEPELQERGAGGRLLDHCLAIACDPGAGVREVRLSVAENNARGRRLFASRGFRLRDGYAVYPAGQRAIMMRRTT